MIHDIYNRWQETTRNGWVHFHEIAISYLLGQIITPFRQPANGAPLTPTTKITTMWYKII